MKTITTDKMTIGLVEVPDGANRFKVFNDDNPYISFFLEMRTPRLYLHPGSYIFLSTTKDLTEEVAKKFLSYTIESEKMHYRDYKHPAFLERQLYWFDNWQESFSSLLKVNGLNPSKNYAILEIKK